VTDAVAKWFLDERGITLETLENFGVRVEGDSVIFPYADGEKTRKGIPNGERRFFFTKGKRPGLFNEQAALGKHVFLCEGETDTMRLCQELAAAGADTGAVGLSGIETWTPELADKFSNADRVWVILDNDQDYNVQGRVDTAWRDIRFALGPKARRVKLPPEVKDVCEFFERYNLDALRLIVERQPAAGASRWKLLDLTLEPPPVQWLVDDLVCRGDIHLILGEPGIGKSWLTMSLALAVASGADEWLGHKLHEAGKVLYLDEENPEDLVYDRFRKLGMTEADAKNIRYINNEGIRLDRIADDLLDEALEFGPTLIVLDSLTRFHTEDENNAGAMSKLFNEALKPLARKTHAAVVLIHHAKKTDSNSSYHRSRGSGDITASVDSGLDVREIAMSTLAVSVFKSRRRKRDEFPIHVQLTDTPEGNVKLLGGVAQEVPF